MMSNLAEQQEERRSELIRKFVLRVQRGGAPQFAKELAYAQLEEPGRKPFRIWHVIDTLRQAARGEGLLDDHKQAVVEVFGQWLDPEDPAQNEALMNLVEHYLRELCRPEVAGGLLAKERRYERMWSYRERGATE
jgi:hypothetical protein